MISMNNIRNMEPRERNMVMAAAAFIALTILWVGVYEPLAARRATMKNKIETKAEELAEASALSGRMESLRAGLNKLEADVRRRPQGLSLVGEIEGLAQMTGARENITGITPQQPQTAGNIKETLLDVNMQKITLARLVRFAEGVRNSDASLRVKRVSIKPQFKDPSLLDVSITIAGYEAAQ
ncbi:MAG: type II secretion system protein M [Nitrospinae bacterium]|nr:type II secretion system protein M [Nitrospinota bacterium]